MRENDSSVADRVHTTRYRSCGAGPFGTVMKTICAGSMPRRLYASPVAAEEVSPESVVNELVAALAKDISFTGSVSTALLSTLWARAASSCCWWPMRVRSDPSLSFS